MREVLERLLTDSYVKYEVVFDNGNGKHMEDATEFVKKIEAIIGEEIDKPFSA